MKISLFTKPRVGYFKPFFVDDWRLDAFIVIIIIIMECYYGKYIKLSGVFNYAFDNQSNCIH